MSNDRTFNVEIFLNPTMRQWVAVSTQEGTSDVPETFGEGTTPYRAVQALYAKATGEEQVAVQGVLDLLQQEMLAQADLEKIQ